MFNSLVKVVMVLMLLVGSVSADIQIQTPDKAQNGSVVPVTITFSPKLSKNEKVVVKVDNQEAMWAILYEGSVSIISSRVRMFNSGNIKVMRMGNNITESKSKKVIIQKGSSKRTNTSKLVRSKGKIRIKNKGNVGTYKALFKTKDYGFDNVLALSDDGFYLEIKGSSLISKNPYISVKGSFGKNASTSVIDDFIEDYTPKRVVKEKDRVFNLFDAFSSSQDGKCLHKLPNTLKVSFGQKFHNVKIKECKKVNGKTEMEFTVKLNKEFNIKNSTDIVNIFSAFGEEIGYTNQKLFDSKACRPDAMGLKCEISFTDIYVLAYPFNSMDSFPVIFREK